MKKAEAQMKLRMKLRMNQEVEIYRKDLDVGGGTTNTLSVDGFVIEHMMGLDESSTHPLVFRRRLGYGHPLQPLFDDLLLTKLTWPSFRGRSCY